MELSRYSIAFLLAAMCVPLVLSCDTNKLTTECLPKLTELSTMAGDSSSEGLEKACKVLKDMTACMKPALEGCTGNPGQAFDSALNSWKGKCNGSNRMAEFSVLAMIAAVVAAKFLQ